MGLQHHGKAQTVFLCGDRERIERERERGIGTLQWGWSCIRRRNKWKVGARLEKWGKGPLEGGSNVRVQKQFVVLFQLSQLSMSFQTPLSAPFLNPDPFPAGFKHKNALSFSTQQTPNLAYCFWISTWLGIGFFPYQSSCLYLLLYFVCMMLLVSFIWFFFSLYGTITVLYGFCVLFGSISKKFETFFKFNKCFYIYLTNFIKKILRYWTCSITIF